MDRHSKITALIILLAVVCAVIGIMYMMQPAKDADEPGTDIVSDAETGQTLE